jgi:hypothetical protein
MDIKEFLRTHPFIKVYSIEKELNLPVGTIRVNNPRPIPEKYQQLIVESLANYNPIKTHVVVEERKVPEVVFKPVLEPIDGDRYFVIKTNIRVGGKYAYQIKVEYADKTKKIKIEATDDIPDGTPVILG